MNIDEAICDGCGNCIPQCVEGALKIVKGKARIVKEDYCDGLGACLGRCPRGAISIVERETTPFDENAAQKHLKEIQIQRAKSQWPVKLNLVPVEASFLHNAHLLVAADCIPVALRSFHTTLLQRMTVLIGCPKFDDAEAYAEKLSQILRRNDVARVTIAHMEVPCCSGLWWVVDKAVHAAGKDIPVRRYVVTVAGEINEV